MQCHAYRLIMQHMQLSGKNIPESTKLPSRSPRGLLLAQCHHVMQLAFMSVYLASPLAFMSVYLASPPDTLYMIHSGLCSSACKCLQIQLLRRPKCQVAREW
jgi:hypothetical protein